MTTSLAPGIASAKSEERWGGTILSSVPVMTEGRAMHRRETTGRATPRHQGFPSPLYTNLVER
jgi:hypothetical protein